MKWLNWNPYFSDCLLDLDMFTIYEKIKSFYSEQLFIWGLSSQRLCVLKASSCQESQQDQEEHDNLKVAKSKKLFFKKNCPKKTIQKNAFCLNIAHEKPKKLSKISWKYLARA